MKTVQYSLYKNNENNGPETVKNEIKKNNPKYIECNEKIKN